MADSPGENRSPAATRQFRSRPPRSRPRLNRRAIAALVVAAATIGGLPGSASVSVPGAKKHPRDVTVLCGQDAHLITRTGVDIRNNNFDGSRSA